MAVFVSIVPLAVLVGALWCVRRASRALDEGGELPDLCDEIEGLFGPGEGRG